MQLAFPNAKLQPQVYLYTTGFVFLVDGTGVRVNVNANPQPLSIVTNSLSGKPGLMQGSNYLNIDSNGISMSSTFQPIYLLANGNIAVETKDKVTKYFNINLQGQSSLDDTPLTRFNFVVKPNNTALKSNDSVGIYNVGAASFFPYNYEDAKVIASTFLPSQICDTVSGADQNCYIRNKKGENVCAIGTKRGSILGCAIGCPSDVPQMEYIGCDQGSTFRQSQNFCFRQRNFNNVESCAAPDDSVLVDDKLNQCVCLQTTPNQQISNQCFNTDGSGGCLKSQLKTPLTQTTFAPWSIDVKDAQSIKTFCSQHDPLSQGPYLFTDSRCLNWATDNPEAYNATLDSYCRQHPNTTFCASFCANQTADKSTCNFSMGQWCSDFANVASPACREWCKNPNINCDASISSYCRSLGSPTDALATDPELCGCFLPTTFYDNYFKSLKDKIVVPPNFQPNKQCFFGSCAQSKIQPFVVKNSEGRLCPNVQTCLQNITFSNNGTITGNVNITNNNSCNFSIPLTYKFKTGDWGECQRQADGTGVQTRSVTCVANEDGSLGSDDKCLSSGLKPASFQACTPTSEDIASFSYLIGPWDLCKNGKQSRTVVCVDKDQNMVADMNCKNEKPAMQQSCGEEPPNGPTGPTDPVAPDVVYKYHVTEWSDCKDGKQTRNVLCYNDTDFIKVDNSFCKGSKPISSQPCFTPNVVSKKNLYLAIALGTLGTYTLLKKNVSVVITGILFMGMLYYANKYQEDKTSLIA